MLLVLLVRLDPSVTMWAQLTGDLAMLSGLTDTVTSAA